VTIVVRQELVTDLCRCVGHCDWDGWSSNWLRATVANGVLGTDLARPAVFAALAR
jgi:hypothetical protein